VRTGPTVLLAGGTAYALVAASTTPFTLPADALTALAIVVMAVAVVVCWPLHTTKSPDPAGGRRYLPWVALAVVFAAWELVNYAVHGSRAAHPTFSSITDAIDRFYLLKAALFLGWLGFGWMILRRGAARPGPADRHGAARPGPADRHGAQTDPP
jgi:hypothetical protein